MQVKEFCQKLAGHFFAGHDRDTLAKDFEWLVESGRVDAFCGYSPNRLLTTNLTAIQLCRRIGEAINAAILGCSYVGRGKCAEDEEYVQEKMKETLNHYGIFYKV